MIPKAYRLKLGPHQPFRGHKHSFSWGIVISSLSNDLKLATSVSKKVSPSAVVRNKLRRQLIQGLYSRRHQLNPHLSLHLIVSRPGTDNTQILDQICSVFTAS